MTDLAATNTSATQALPRSMTAASTDDLKKILIIFSVVALAVGVPCAVLMDWYWLDPGFTNAIGLKPSYLYLFGVGILYSAFLLVFSVVFGMAIAIFLGLVQVTGPWWLAALAKGYCNVIRGTPLLIQLWLLYFGVGSLFPSIPGIRESIFWPILANAWPYALLAFTLNFAGYEGEVMRGAFASVPKGELEAGRAFGMSPFKLLRRIWLPRAIHQALPTLSGEIVLQLKSTPLAATITIADVYGVGYRVRQDLYIVYQPLLFVALIYALMALLIVLLFRWLENKVPVKRG